MASHLNCDMISIVGICVAAPLHWMTTGGLIRVRERSLAPVEKRAFDRKTNGSKYGTLTLRGTTPHLGKYKLIMAVYSAALLTYNLNSKAKK